MDDTTKTIFGKRDKLEVVIYSQTHKIIGAVHTMVAGRLVDFLNSKAMDLFIVVTGAEVYKLPEEELILSADFFAINKKAIMMVFPKPSCKPEKSGKHNEE